MKTFTFTKNFFLAVLTSMIIALSVTGCSDDEGKVETQKIEKSERVAVKPHPAHNPFDHSHDVEVTDIQKHKFEHDFAQQCVDRELKNSANKDMDEHRYDEPCMCIATYLMKNLTAEEAEKFIGEHKNAQSLVIKYENAAYHCLQEKVQPKGPHLFGRQKVSD